MPMNTDALKDSVNGHKPQAKRPHPNRDQQQQQLDQVDQTTATAIASLAQAGVNSINAQVFAFDSKLTRYERDTARAMADRLRQSNLRIQQYLVEELTTQNAKSTDFATLVDDALDVPDLTSSFLGITQTAVAGCLPL
jgi:uncharacterized protein YqfA (UPF0365 family)